MCCVPQCRPSTSQLMFEGGGRLAYGIDRRDRVTGHTRRNGCLCHHCDERTHGRCGRRTLHARLTPLPNESRKYLPKSYRGHSSVRWNDKVHNRVRIRTAYPEADATTPRRMRAHHTASPLVAPRSRHSATETESRCYRFRPANSVTSGVAAGLLVDDGDRKHPLQAVRSGIAEHRDTARIHETHAISPGGTRQHRRHNRFQWIR
jgi:hypothetical protein